MGRTRIPLGCPVPLARLVRHQIPWAQSVAPCGWRPVLSGCCDVAQGVTYPHLMNSPIPGEIASPAKAGG